MTGRGKWLGKVAAIEDNEAGGLGLWQLRLGLEKERFGD